jgi:polyhydroxybutyrate depolymerase
LPGPPGAEQSHGCIGKLVQHVSDPATLQWLGTPDVERRYLVYVPSSLPRGRLPVVFVFPGATASAEVAAFHYTHLRFETLADRDGFVVVYGNGLPQSPWPDMTPSVPEGGFLRSCESRHEGEGIDVAYVRAVLAALEAELPIDRARVYATGLSAGGGLCFALAIEAPDLVAAVAPVVPVAYQPSGPALGTCHPRPGLEEVSIAMLASTDDPFVAYAGGGSVEYPNARNPGMEATRDAWIAALGLPGGVEVDPIADIVQGDSYEPLTGRTSSTVERQRYRAAPDGRELWFYKAVGMGHWWPSPTQMWSGLWSRFGKNNQDMDFADEAWAFFRRHAKQRAPSGGR